MTPELGLGPQAGLTPLAGTLQFGTDLTPEQLKQAQRLVWLFHGVFSSYLG